MQNLPNFRLPSNALPKLAALVCGASLACAASAASASDMTTYCTDTTGVATEMHPYSNTNSEPKLWMAYGGKAQACTYTNADTSRITIWLTTLTSSKPTMAALAYYAKVKPGKSQGNPSDAYCNKLGGSWQIGNGADGGGWAAQRSADVWIYDMCVFADGSAIDAWGLFYHSADIIRGIDLATVLKFPNPY